MFRGDCLYSVSRRALAGVGRHKGCPTVSNRIGLGREPAFLSGQVAQRWRAVFKAVAMSAAARVTRDEEGIADLPPQSPAGRLLTRLPDDSRMINSESRSTGCFSASSPASKRSKVSAAVWPNLRAGRCTEVRGGVTYAAIRTSSNPTTAMSLGTRTPASRKAVNGTKGY